MKSITKEWLLKAHEDIWAADLIVKEDYYYTAVATSHCQQAIEKYFKAFLLEHGWKLVKTHDLPELYEEIKKIKDFNLNENIISEIYDRYSGTRYPDDYNPPTQEQTREFYKFALEVQKKITEELDPLKELKELYRD
jgi:HEPN domain-containing protein